MGATFLISFLIVTCLISIHAPLRERRTKHLHVLLILIFQSTLPHGSDLNNELTKAKIKTISIHAPSRERCKTISIHAPSRERCLKKSLCAACLAISIHAPSRERPRFESAFVIFVLFQSTLPRGSDFSFVVALSSLRISIHAPSRERL